MGWGVEETSLPKKIIFGPVTNGRYVWLSDVFEDFDPDEQADALRAEMTGAAVDYETQETFTDSGEWTFRWSVCRDTSKSPFEIVEYDPEDEDEISGLVVENPRGKDFNSMTGMGRFVEALMTFVPADELQDWGMPEDIRTFFGKTFVLEETEFDSPYGTYTVYLPIELASGGKVSAPKAKQPEDTKAKLAAAKAKSLKKAETPVPQAEDGISKLEAAVIKMAGKYSDESEFFEALFDPTVFRGAEKLLEDQELTDRLPEIWEEHGNT